MDSCWSLFVVSLVVLTGCSSEASGENADSSEGAATAAAVPPIPTTKIECTGLVSSTSDAPVESSFTLKVENGVLVGVAGELRAELRQCDANRWSEALTFEAKVTRIGPNELDTMVHLDLEGTANRATQGTTTAADGTCKESDSAAVTTRPTVEGIDLGYHLDASDVSSAFITLSGTGWDGGIDGASCKLADQTASMANVVRALRARAK